MKVRIVLSVILVLGAIYIAVALELKKLESLTGQSKPFMECLNGVFNDC